MFVKTNKAMKRRINLFMVIQVLMVAILLSGCSGAPQKKSAESQFQIRALWVDPPGFKDRETVDKLIEKCERAGINMLLPDVMLRNEVWFKSENFVGKVHADEEYDPLAYMIEKAHAAGIKVQPWSCTYYSEPKHPDWISKPFVDNNYKHVFLSAAHPDVNPYLLSVLGELLEYDIDGIHLDYSRYWNAAFDYSEPAANRFKSSFDFDPRDFYDHPERIVAPEQDPYPVRMLCPDASTPNVPTLGVLERNLNRTGIGYAYVSEKIANIDGLRAPGLLIVSYYNQMPDDMGKALERYVKRGGDIIWISPNNDLLNKESARKLTGLKGVEGFKSERITLQVTDEIFGKAIDTVQARLSGSSLVPDNAEIVARLDSDEPVVTVNRKEKGKVAVIGFQLMNSDSPQVMDYFRDAINGLRKEAGITAPDPMGEKRKQWNEWRASHIKELFREVTKMVKEKDPNLPVTTAAGMGPQQFNGIYRDSRELLGENIVDYIFPMNYSNRIDIFKDILDEQAFYTPEGMAEKIYPGLQLYNREGGSTVPIDAAIVDQQLEMVKEYGYHGFCLFAYSYFSDEMVEVIEQYSH